MSRWFAVIRTRGPKWDFSRPMREQALWNEHATFTDGLEEAGLIRLAGPLDDVDTCRDVLLIMRGDSPEALEARLSQDPWTPADMIHTTRISPWQVLVGNLE